MEEEHAPPDSGIKLTPFIVVLTVLIVLSGVTTGYFLSGRVWPGVSEKTTDTGGSGIKKGTIFGSDDTKTFRDITEGTLERGGIDGEGSHHLVRPGGESQNVYLTSSIIDLDQFIGRKIKVWGETNKAQKAGWLMDVGRVEVLD